MTNRLGLKESPNAPGTAHEADDRRTRPRRRIVTAALAVLVVGGITASLLIAWQGAPSAPAPSVAAGPVTTTPVTTGDLIAMTNVKGTLRYSGEGRLLAGSAGVLTSTPAPGTVIAAGAELYRVNDSPVFLLRGEVPAWRAFELGMTEGDDVRQLEQNLRAFGVFRGDPDKRFTGETTTAVRTWQRAVGMEQTGRLDRSVAHFAPGDLRVAQLTAGLGADVAPGTEVYQVTSTTKVVDLSLRLADQQLAVVGAPISIDLPDGTETSGVIASVGQPMEQTTDSAGSGNATSTFVVPVSISLDNPDAASQFPRASVTARFSTTLGADALTVPVDALIAVDADTFAVEVPSDTADGTVERIPVTLGAFSSGRVAVSGPGIEAGTAVVVPSS